MTEPIAVDVPAKPAAPAVPAPKAELPKPAAKPAEPSKPPFPKPPAPAATGPTLLERLGKNKAGIGAAALFSLAAGIAGVRLLTPPDEPAPETAAKQPAANETPAPPKPSISLETIPPAGLPVVPSAGGAPAPAAPVLPPVVAVDPAPSVGGVPAAPPAALPPVSAVVPTVPAAGGPTAPAVPPAVIPPPSGDGFGAPKIPAAGAGDPPPPDLGDPIIPVAGAQPPKKDNPPPVSPKNDAGPDLPKLPTLPGTSGLDPKNDAVPKISAPKLDPVPPAKDAPPALPKIDVGGGGALPVPPPPAGGALSPMPKEKEPEKKVQGLPPVPSVGAGTVPTVPLPTPPAVGSGGVPPVPPDLGTPPAKAPDLGVPPKAPDLGTPPAVAPKTPDLSTPTPPAVLPKNTTPAGGVTGTGGTPIEFTKPAGGTTAAPAARQPNTTYDEDIYTLKAGDNWESVSREFYGDARYASALSAYNRGQAGPGRTVNVPPIHVVKKYLPAAVTATPAGGAGAGGTPDWGAATPASRPAAEKPYVTPGGLSMRGIARSVLGSEQRWSEIYNLNPHLKPDDILPAGTELKMPPTNRNP